MYTFNLIWSTVPHWIAWLLVVLDFIWELPQNLCGLVVKLVYCKYGSRKVQTRKQGECTIQNWGMSSGVSLGWYQYTSQYASIDTVSHEVGHSIQSLYLGPLYLLVIGLPSIIWCALHTYTSLRWKYSYYSFYTESWANKLSGAYGG